MSTHADLVAAVVERLADADVPAFEIDQIKDPALHEVTIPAGNYAEVHLSSTVPGMGRLARRGKRFGWRLQVRVVAKTVTNWQVFAGRVHDALYDEALFADGRWSTRLGEIPGDLPEFDDLFYVGLLEFDFTYRY